VDSQMACEDIAAPSTVSNDLAVAVRNALDKVGRRMNAKSCLKRVAAGLTYAAIADMARGKPIERGSVLAKSTGEARNCPQCLAIGPMRVSSDRSAFDSASG